MHPTSSSEGITNTPLVFPQLILLGKEGRFDVAWLPFKGWINSPLIVQQLSDPSTTMDIPERAQPLATEQLSSQIFDLVSQCASLKQIKKGANQATKTLNRGITELIIIAADANPLQIVLHLPILCEEKNVPYVFVESKKALGTACGTTRNVITVSILKNKQSKLNDQIKTVTDQCERLFVSS